MRQNQQQLQQHHEQAIFYLDDFAASPWTAVTHCSAKIEALDLRFFGVEAASTNTALARRLDKLDSDLATQFELIDNDGRQLEEQTLE